jgi:hypothetical protein
MNCKRNSRTAGQESAESVPTATGRRQNESSSGRAFARLFGVLEWAGGTVFLGHSSERFGANHLGGKICQKKCGLVTLEKVRVFHYRSGAPDESQPA